MLTISLSIKLCIPVRFPGPLSVPIKSEGLKASLVPSAPPSRPITKIFLSLPASILNGASNSSVSEILQLILSISDLAILFLT